MSIDVLTSSGSTSVASDDKEPPGIVDSGRSVVSPSSPSSGGDILEAIVSDHVGAGETLGSERVDVSGIEAGAPVDGADELRSSKLGSAVDRSETSVSPN